MKSFYILSLLVLVSLFNSTAQVNEWVWMHGSSTPNGAEHLGTQGTASPANDPPAVYEPCEWRDTSGNFWIFGGKDTTGSFHDDLWRYNPTTNVWTWMKGNGFTNDPGNYGTKGVPSLANYPPSIGFGVPTWVDLNNNLWMYGGGGVGNTDDLWRYDIANNEWTWMKGEDSSLAVGVYGTMGVPDTANHPGMRSETAATWTDAAGDLWLFGGAGYHGSMNDLWRFNIATNTWTWMKGSNQAFQFSKYGTEGVEKSTNIPASRYAYSHWKDKSGNFWLFGGLDGVGSEFNDMWRYNPATNNWTWMSGTNILYVQGSDGTECTFLSTNVPYSRFENRACWTDPNGDFWLFGGGVSSNGGFSNTYNDLWKYCVSSNQWVWISGDSTLNPGGSWGFKGVPSATNVPNGRGGAVGWSDMKNHFFVFGGTTSPFGDMYNDVWKYFVDTTCAVCAASVPPVAAFLSSDTTFCANDCISFTDLGSNATSWSWSFPGGLPSSSTDENPQSVCYLASGTYNVTFIASNSLGSDTVNVSNFINVIAVPPTPTITRSNDTLYCSTDPSYSAFQWYDSTALISGATDTFLVINHGGNYNVQVSNSNGCSTAVGINIVLGLTEIAVNGVSFTVVPDPADDEILLNGNWKQGISNVIIYNMLGERMIERQMELSGREEINIKDIAAGVYFIQVQNEKGSWTARFVKSGK